MKYVLFQKRNGKFTNSFGEEDAVKIRAMFNDPLMDSFTKEWVLLSYEAYESDFTFTDSMQIRDSRLDLKPV